MQEDTLPLTILKDKCIIRDKRQLEHGNLYRGHYGKSRLLLDEFIPVLQLDYRLTPLICGCHFAFPSRVISQRACCQHVHRICRAPCVRRCACHSPRKLPVVVSVAVSRFKALDSRRASVPGLTTPRLSKLWMNRCGSISSGISSFGPTSAPRRMLLLMAQMVATSQH